MPRGLSIPVFVIAALWGLFTIIVYAMILYGSVVELWGVNNTLTFKHYVTAFSVRIGEQAACAGPVRPGTVSGPRSISPPSPPR